MFLPHDGFAMHIIGIATHTVTISVPSLTLKKQLYGTITDKISLSKTPTSQRISPHLLISKVAQILGADHHYFRI